jgi:hypothetical protein
MGKKTKKIIIIIAIFALILSAIAPFLGSATN